MNPSSVFWFFKFSKGKEGGRDKNVKNRQGKDPDRHTFGSRLPRLGLRMMIRIPRIFTTSSPFFGIIGGRMRRALFSWQMT